MTFDDNSNIRGGRVSRRTGTGLAIGGGGGLVVLIVVLISAFSGVDLTGLLGGSGSGTGTDSPLSQCQTGKDANKQLDCRIQAAATSLDAYWSGQVDAYTQPQVILFTGQTDTGCGAATTAVGPFYCPQDQTVYLDTGFYDALRTTYGSSGGPLAQLYVVAHEWGHHIQNLTGRMDGLDLRETGATSDSVRLELQADCYAGSWVGGAEQTKDADGTPFLEPITPDQVTDALSAAAAVGDDRIQASTQGGVDPDTWTHGSSAERQRWFERGRNGGPNACDTFSTSTL